MYVSIQKTYLEINNIKISFDHIYFISLHGREIIIHIKPSYLFFYENNTFRVKFKNKIICREYFLKLNNNKTFNLVNSSVYFLDHNSIYRVIKNNKLYMKKTFSLKESKTIIKFDFQKIKINYPDFIDLCYKNYNILQSQRYRLKTLETLLKKNITTIIFSNVYLRMDWGQDCHDYDLDELIYFLKYLSTRVINIKIDFHYSDTSIVEKKDYKKIMKANKFITYTNWFGKTPKKMRSLKEICIMDIKKRNVDIQKYPKLLFRV